MKKYTIAAIGLGVEEYALTKANDADNLIHIEIIPETLIDMEEERKKILEFVKQKVDTVLLAEHSFKVERKKFYQQLKDEAGAVPIIPVGTEVIEAGIYNIDLASVQEINRYFFMAG